MLCDEAWCRRFEAQQIPHEVPVVVHGEWEMRDPHRAFEAWHDTLHVVDKRPSGRLWTSTGTDHGKGARLSRPTLLVAVDQSGPLPVVWVVDERMREEATDDAGDASDILDMLAVHHLTWSGLDYRFGDRAHVSGKNRTTVRSNETLEEALTELLGVVAAPIENAKTGAGAGSGSVDLGIAFIHQCLVSGRFKVHPRCVRLIRAMNRWKGKDDEFKHVIDALRYALKPWIVGEHSDGSGVTLVVP